MNLKLNAEKFTSFFKHAYFRIMVLVPLSNNLIMPSVNKTVKQIAVVRPAGMYCRMIVPTKRDNPTVLAHRIVMTKADVLGIFILLLPYAKLATKASMDIAEAMMKACNRDGKVMCNMKTSCELMSYIMIFGRQVLCYKA